MPHFHVMFLVVLIWLRTKYIWKNFFINFPHPIKKNYNLKDCCIDLMEIIILLLFERVIYYYQSYQSKNYFTKRTT